MNVKMFDTLQFRCPYVDKTMTSQNTANFDPSSSNGDFPINLYPSIFFVDKEGYENCDASRGMLLKKCLHPYDVIMPYGFYVTNVSASEYLPEVEARKTYYFICEF